MRFARLLPAAVVVALGAAFGAGTARAERVLVDRVVAVVTPSDPQIPDARVVLASTLEIVARIRIVERRNPEMLWAPLTGEYLAAVLDEMVNEILLFDEAARLGLDRVSVEAAAQERAGFEARFLDPERLAEMWTAYDWTDADVSEYFRRRRVVREFLSANVSTLGGSGGAPDVRAAVEYWVSSLRARSKVRVLVD